MSANIRIRFLAIFKDAAGKKEITQAIHNETTLGDVLTSLANKYGKDFQQTIDKKTRQVDFNTLVMINGKNTRDTNIKLKDNDLIIMTVPLGGGGGSDEMSEARCLNCLKRFAVPPKAETAICPHCKTKYRISWPTPTQAKVRGLS